MPLSRMVLEHRVWQRFVAVLLAYYADHHWGLAGGLWGTLMAVLVLQVQPRLTVRHVLLSVLGGMLLLGAFSLLYHPTIAYMRLHDAFIGGCIGVLASLCGSTQRDAQDFRIAMQELSLRYMRFAQGIAHALQDETPLVRAGQKDIEILQLTRAVYPVWVYAADMNSYLQSGQIYFFALAERLGQLLYILHDAVLGLEHAELSVVLHAPLSLAGKELVLALEALKSKLENPNTVWTLAAYAEAVQILQGAYHNEVVMPLVYVDADSEYVKTYAVLAVFQDLQIVLTKLSESLC